MFFPQDFSMGSTEVKGTLTSVVIMANKKTVEKPIDSHLRGIQSQFS